MFDAFSLFLSQISFAYFTARRRGLIQDSASMDDLKWEFNAPTTVIDFASGEHMNNAGVDENYFNYNHEESPEACKSMELKPSGLTDITNKSRLTFDSPAKPTLKTPVIKLAKSTPRAPVIMKGESHDENVVNQDEQPTSAVNAGISTCTLISDTPADGDDFVFDEPVTGTVCQQLGPATYDAGSSEVASPSAANTVEIGSKQAFKERSTTDDDSLDEKSNALTDAHMLSSTKAVAIPSDSVDDRMDTEAATSSTLKKVTNDSKEQAAMQKNVTPKECTSKNVTPRGANQKRRSSGTNCIRTRSQKKKWLRIRSRKVTPQSDPDAPPLKKLKGTDPVCKKSAKAPLRSRSARLTTPRDGAHTSYPMDRRSCSSTPVFDFAQGLRQYPTSQKKMTPTITKPFHFSTDRKRKLDFEAKKNEKFNFDKAAKSIKKGPIAIKPALTIPRTPKLKCKTRTRPPCVISAKEKEEKEIEDMKNYKFKAKPVDSEMLQHPGALPEVEKASVTKTEEFHFRIEKRLEDRAKPEMQPSQSKEFKAKPVPKGIYKAPLIEPAKLQLKIREKKFTKQKSPKPQLAPEKRQNTVVQPFSFYERDMEMLAKKEEKIKLIHEAERAIELEEKTCREQRNFKANENYKESLYKPGWKPTLDGKHTEKFDEFNLHSVTRASQRRDFDAQMKEREARIIALKEERKRHEELQQEEEAKEMRKMTEFKANPVKKCKKFEVKGSDKLLTCPESPNFSDRFYKKLPKDADHAD